MENPLSSCSALRRCRRIGKEGEPSLSNKSFIVDDIITDILSRLPAKDVLRFRCVCRRWKDLTSTRDFTDLHSRRSFPMLLKDYHGLALLDRCWEPGQTRSRIHKVYEQYERGLQICQNGLIVGEGRRGMIIYNLIYRDVVKISVPVEPSKRKVYGLFFHPVIKEYCTLWRITLSYQPCKVQYKILNLECNPHWRDIRNPCTQKARISCMHPILIDKYLYWMIDPFENYNQIYYYENSTINCDIMEYDIRNEEFRVIPCPVPVTIKHFKYNVNLIDIDGVVSVVQVFPSKELVEINIWTLKDHGELLWTSSQYIVSSDVYPGFCMPKAVAFWNGELVLESYGRIYVCNLKLGTFKKFGRLFNDDVKLFSHVTSLVSLRNWKSNICIVEEDEKILREGGCDEEIQAVR